LPDGALEEWLAGHGEPAYRARQVRDALWRQNGPDGDELKTLPAPSATVWPRRSASDTIVDDEVKVADGGHTEKTLHLLGDGALIESVLIALPGARVRRPGRMVHRERNTLCISSQAGCAVGCPFCATGELGFGRDSRDRRDRRPGLATPPTGWLLQAAT